LNGQSLTHESIRKRVEAGIGHIPEDRHKYGLILDFRLDSNLVLHDYYKPEFQQYGLIKADAVRAYADRLIEEFDVRTGEGSKTFARSMSGGNQQKAIIAREIDRSPDLLIAAQPTRGLDVGAIEYIHKRLVAERDAGKAVLLVSLELEEVLNVSDRIAVIYEGEIVGIIDAADATANELGLMMSGSKRGETHGS
jgi:simple sugar transport system ATP-binding protein